jgi:urease accessory protein
MTNNIYSRIIGFAILASTLMFLFPSFGFTHVEQGQAGGFITGIEHPWSGLDHILAMVAVGLWGAQLGNPCIWLLPIAFPMMMAVGAMMGLLSIPVPGVEIGIAVSAIVLGFMIFAEVRPKPVIAIILVGFFAIFHGHAHGTELPPGQSGLLYSMGFILGTGCLHAVGIIIGLVHRWSVGKLLLRGGGALIALMGGVFLWQAIV